MDVETTNLFTRYNTPGSTHGLTYCVGRGKQSKLTVDPTQLGDFLKEYCLAVDDGQVLSIAEPVLRRSDYMPMIVSMVFRFEEHKDTELYTDKFLLNITHIIQAMVNGHVLLQPDTPELIMCVLETDPWEEKTQTVTRLRFHMPYCVINTMYQQKVLLPELIRRLRADNTIKDMAIQPIGDWDTIIERTPKYISMYGSCNEVGQSAFKVTHYYRIVNFDDVEQQTNCEVPLDNFFKPLDHYYFQRRIINHHMIDVNKDEESELNIWVPLLLSLDFSNVVCNPRQVEPSTKPTSIIDRDYDDDKNPQSIVEALLPLLSLDRFTTEHYWLDVGRVLYQVTDGAPSGLKLWIYYSGRCQHYDRDEKSCRQQYHLFEKSHLTEKTIAWYAKEDNPDRYSEWHDQWVKKPFAEALSLTNEKVAEAIYRCFWLDYMCYTLSKNGWYRFDRNYLKQMDDAVHLRARISDAFINKCYNMRADLNQRAYQSRNEDERKGYEITIDCISKLITKLETQSYRNAVVSILREKFYVEGIEVDADPYKVGFRNCVIECCGDHAYPRTGKPEDFITKTTGIAYPMDMNHHDPIVKKLKSWLTRVFVDVELFEFFITDCASMLYGRNAEKKFRIWTGDTDNSKSMVVKLIKAVLGVYCIDFPVNMICGKAMASSSGPTPELAQAKGAHVAFVSEPDSNEELKGAKIKRYTGGDGFFGRACNENGGTIEATFKLILMSNRIPDFDGIDKGVYGRCLIIPFLSTWVDDPPETEEEQFRLRLFKKDPFFENEIPEMAPAMAWLMVQYYTAYMQNGLKIPEIVKQHTQHHWDATDPFVGFIKDCIESDGVSELRVQQCYDTFKIWYRTNNPAGVIPKNAYFRSEMARRLGGKDTDRVWKGHRLKAYDIKEI